jgi:hypothetical protein
MKPAPREDASENIPGRGDALAVLAADADCEIYFRKWFPPVTDGTILLAEASLGKFAAPPMRSLPGYGRAMQVRTAASLTPCKTVESGYRIIGGVGDFRGVMVRVGVGF